MNTRLVRFMVAIYLALSASLVALARPPVALAAVQVLDPRVQYTFGGPITFTARLESDTPVKEVILSFQSQGDPHTIANAVTLALDGRITYTYESFPQPLRAFSRVKYWFNVSLKDGNSYTSPEYDFFYEDNRFKWQTLESQPFHVHWYDGNTIFAQSAIDVAQEGLQHIQSILLLKPVEDMNIYIYDNRKDMQDTLRLSGQNWVAGHADPDLGIAVVYLPSGPEQRLLTEQRIPHELMHILLYHALGNGYNNLPTWLNEGLATIAELSPDPDYQVVLDTAVENKSFITIASLCQSFPTDQSGAWLAYAESASFTRYLFRQYGSSGLQALIGSYTNGLECQRGVEAALGLPLSRLEEQWHSEIFGPAPQSKEMGELGPWFALLLVVLLVPLVLAFAGLRQSRREEPESEDTGVYAGQSG